MEALRCPGCGETRWHILPVKLEAHVCAICGEQMVTERRRPGRARKPPVLERRSAPVLTRTTAPGT